MLPIATPVARAADLPQSSEGGSGITPEAVTPSGRWQLPIWIKVAWGASAVAAIACGWFIAGSLHSKRLAAVSASAASAIDAARAAGFEDATAKAPRIPAQFDLSRPEGLRPLAEIIKSEPAKRSRLEAVALGRQWQERRFDEYNRFATELRAAPQKLEESKTRSVALDFVRDRLTSRAMLELLSEMATPRALDLLYEVWIGSKDRNETTQLAEALLLVPEVRQHASGALELALALRDKPTSCEEIQKLVDRAIREGDRRSAHQLVTTSARQNCGPDGSRDCVKCLSEVKDMRRAIRASAARPDPVP
jgi:hypothetical protein